MAYDPLIRGMSNVEIANRVLSNHEATDMETELAQRLLDSDNDLNEAIKNQCLCD